MGQLDASAKGKFSTIVGSTPAARSTTIAGSHGTETASGSTPETGTKEE
jgi:hypothetical protein